MNGFRIEAKAPDTAATSSRRGPRAVTPRRWAIVTVEYPPTLGGVSDYTRAVAVSLAARGDEVHVFAPDCGSDMPSEAGITVHRLPGRFGVRALLAINRALDRLSGPFQLLVQYVPQGLGWKGANLPFSYWLQSRAGDAPWVMFHEVALPLVRGMRVAQYIRARAMRLMARVVVRSAARIFVSTPAWGAFLTEIAGESVQTQWLPIPSNVATNVEMSDTRRVRAHFERTGQGRLIGHFGVTGHGGAENLCETLVRLLRSHSDCSGLLIGRQSTEVVARVLRDHADLSGRLYATGALRLDDIAAHLSACDLLIQPYPDGVTGRRTSVMAGLALGVAIVTVDGHLTEGIWRESSAVALAPNDSAAALVVAADRLLSNRVERARLGAAAKALYRHHFSVEHTIQALCGVE